MLYAQFFGLPIFSRLQLLSSAFGGSMLILWLGNRWRSGADTKMAFLLCAAWASMLILSIALAARLNKSHGVLYIYGIIIASM